MDDPDYSPEPDETIHHDDEDDLDRPGPSKWKTGRVGLPNGKSKEVSSTAMAWLVLTREFAGEQAGVGGGVCKDMGYSRGR